MHRFTRCDDNESIEQGDKARTMFFSLPYHPPWACGTASKDKRIRVDKRLRSARAGKHEKEDVVQSAHVV
jgi:hypothetical protein